MFSASELHNRSFSYERSASGENAIVFNDPFTGDRLSSSRVPASIVRQPNLLRGLNYLAQKGREGHHITVAGAPHAEDSIVDMREVQGLAASHDVVLLEGIGHTERERTLVREVGQGRGDIPEGVFSQYGVRQLAAIVGSSRGVYYADIPGDGTPYETSLIEWGGLARPLAEQLKGELSPEVQRRLARAALINIAGSTILREWRMMSAIGSSLSDAERRGDRVDTALLLIGTEHTKTLPKKLGLLGVSSSTLEVRVHSDGESAPIDGGGFDFTTAVRDYRAKLDWI